MASSPRRALRAAAGALLLAGAGFTQAGMFDDDEARRQVAVERKRVDDLRAQQQSAEARLARIEDSLKNQALLDLFTQLESLKADLNKLRGQIEVLNNSVENSAKRQRDMYVDLDTRLARIEQQGAAAAAAPAPASAAAAAAATAPAAAGSAAPAAAASAVAATPPGDPTAETRIYEAAQAQRRLGNYQGAIVGFQNFLKQYPKSNLAPRAQYWIGDSYFNLREFKLAVASQQALIKTYPDSPTVPDALLNIASSQIEGGEPAVGRKTLEDLVARFPLSDAADKAKRRLAAPNAPAAAAAAPAAAAASAGSASAAPPAAAPPPAPAARPAAKP